MRRGGGCCRRIICIGLAIMFAYASTWFDTTFPKCVISCCIVGMLGASSLALLSFGGHTRLGPAVCIFCPGSGFGSPFTTRSKSL